MLSDIVGKKKLRFEFDGTNVKNLLDELVRRYGMQVQAILYDSKGTFNANTQIAINSKEWIPAL